MNTASKKSPAFESASATIRLPDPEHVRLAAISRQALLAPELDCFRRGKSLSSIRFVAHANSVHVMRWLTLLSHTQATVQIETANPIAAYSNDVVCSRPILPTWLKLPMSIRYFLSGLALRFLGPHQPSSLIHAHCASGNGVVAWLSGQRYVIGAYGTEIFGAHERGFAYRWLLKQVLQGAERIQVGSTECFKILTEQFGIPLERIYCLHLGLDDSCFHGVSESQRMQLRREANLPTDEPIWIVNRRTHPHYRTREIAKGFLDYAERESRGRLVLLCGAHQPDYTQSICEMIKSHPEGRRVTVIQRLLSFKEVATWLQLSDYSISVPKTDMFSISTYESLGCGAVLIAADLEAYRPLTACKAIRWMKRFEPSDFEAMFAETSAAWPSPFQEQRQECMRFVQEGFSTENAIRDIASFYLGVPLRKDALAKWAA